MSTSSTDTLIAALRCLARDIESPDGVANAAIDEAADRLAELANRPQWHLVNPDEPNSLPGNDREVLVLDTDNEAYRASLDEDEGWDSGRVLWNPVLAGQYWIELPGGGA